MIELSTVMIIYAQNESGRFNRSAKSPGRCCANARWSVSMPRSQSAGLTSMSTSWEPICSNFGHKRYAQKGIGVPYIRTGLNRRRSYSALARNVAVGRVSKTSLTSLDWAKLAGSWARWRSVFADWPAICSARRSVKFPGIIVVGDPKQRLSNTLNAMFPKASGRKCWKICSHLVSSGSACHADGEESPAVPAALDVPHD